jgi:hypothetical protein
VETEGQEIRRTLFSSLITCSGRDRSRGTLPASRAARLLVEAAWRDAESRVKKESPDLLSS